MATQESRSRISSEIITTFPDNTQKLITAQDVREFMEIINASKFNLEDDNDINFFQDANPEIARPFSSAYQKLLFLIGNTRERKVFYVDSSRVDSGQSTQTQDPNATATSNNGSVSITNTQPSSNNNRIVINFPNSLGFSIERVTATSTGNNGFIYTVAGLQVGSNNVSFRLTRDDTSNTVSSVRFDFFGNVSFYNTEYVADL